MINNNFAHILKIVVLYYFAWLMMYCRSFLETQVSINNGSLVNNDYYYGESHLLNTPMQMDHKTATIC